MSAIDPLRTFEPQSINPQMWAELLSQFDNAARWVQAMRVYRKRDYDLFLQVTDALAQRRTLSPYQLAVKANALLMVGRYKEALALFSLLSADIGVDRNSRYISRYARAMISDINGDREGFSRNAAAASGIRCGLIVRRNLPL